MSKIPVKNIYYMLCYAWDILDEAEKVSIDLDSYDQEINLLAKLINSGFNYQLKRGIYKNYIETTETLSLIKGKINFSDSFKNLTFQKSKAICSFDNYSEDNIYNQLVKAALIRTLHSDHIDKGLAKEVRQTLNLLSNVETIEYQNGMFAKLEIPRNFKFYKFLLSIAEFILTNSSQNQRTGKYQFTNFIKDDHKMRRLYEKFVYNFYLKEIGENYIVESKREKYVGANYEEADSKYIPTLLTDIELKSRTTNERIIIDTKFTQETLTKNMYGQEKMHSKYLMQLMTYLENRRRGTGEVASGILLYPTIDKHYEFSNRIWDYNVSILNINLNEDWEDIRASLIRLIEEHNSKTNDLQKPLAA